MILKYVIYYIFIEFSHKNRMYHNSNDFISILYNFLSISYIIYRFYTIFIDFLQIISILYNFYRFSIILILQFYRKRFFLQKKRPLRENAHTAKYFYVFFSKKKAPAGKCTHGKNIFNNLKDFNNSKGF